MDNGSFITNLRDSGLGGSQRNIYAPKQTQQASQLSQPAQQSQPTPAASGAPMNNPLGKNVMSFMDALNGESAPKSRISRIYNDGGVDVRIPISDVNNRWMSSYEQYHIPGKSLKRALQGAYNGKYTGSEARNILNDSNVLENIYTNIGATLDYNDEQKGAITNLIDSYLDKKYEGQESEPETVTETVTETTTPKGEEKATDTVEYTYKPGDNFGNVLIKMGLSDGRNLWGPNGDVAYYTQQLNNQGIYGNIPIGTTIRLRRRA